MKSGSVVCCVDAMRLRLCAMLSSDNGETDMIAKKLIVTRDSDQRLLKMFMQAYDKMPNKHKDKAPEVVNK